MLVQYGYIIDSVLNPIVVGVKVVDALSLETIDIPLSKVLEYNIVYIGNFKKMFVDNRDIARLFISDSIVPMYRGSGLDLTNVGSLVGKCGSINVCSGCVISDRNGNLVYTDKLSKLEGYLKPFILLDDTLGLCYNININRFDYLINYHFIGDGSYIRIYGFGNIVNNSSLNKSIYKRILKSKSNGVSYFINDLCLIKVPSGKCTITVPEGCKTALFDLGYNSRPILSDNEIVLPLSVSNIDDSIFMMSNSKMFISKRTNPNIIANLMLNNAYLEQSKSEIVRYSNSLDNIVNLFNRLVNTKSIGVVYLD